MASSEVFSAVRPNVCIIVLNWNGWRDTVECLESVAMLNYASYQVLIVDNGSTDHSPRHIKDWAAGTIEKIETKFPQWVYPLTPKPVHLIVTEDVQKPLMQEQKKATYFLIELKENIGFARGVNAAIDFALQNLQCEYFYLLNNDTVLQPTALSELISAFEKNPEIAAAQSTIYYYDQPEHIANAGGRIFPWGQTIYYKSIADNEIKPITFINGCALCLPKGTIEKYGKLTEKFFFGEEDFEFSMRAKKFGLKLAAVSNSRVYHKIGVSSEKKWQNISQKVFISGLNRLIDLKSYYPKYYWEVWRLPILFYYFLLLILRYKVPFRYSLRLIKKIYKLTSVNEIVNKDMIELNID